jgi:hypothetical protein
MSAKAVAIWCVAVLLLAVAAAAWLGYLGNGLAYGDVYGVRGNEAELAILGAHAARSLALAIVSEALGVAIIAWRVSSEKVMPRRLLAAICISLLADACTFALVRGI